MAVIQKRVESNFGELQHGAMLKAKAVALESSKTLIKSPSSSNIDVIAQLNHNLDQLQDLSDRFQFLLEELSTVLVRRSLK